MRPVKRLWRFILALTLATRPSYIWAICDHVVQKGTTSEKGMWQHLNGMWSIMHEGHLLLQESKSRFSILSQCMPQARLRAALSSCHMDHGMLGCPRWLSHSLSSCSLLDMQEAQRQKQARSKCHIRAEAWFPLGASKLEQEFQLDVPEGRSTASAPLSPSSSSSHN